MSPPIFRDRTDAGIQLARAISTTITQMSAFTIMPPQVVYGLPRGGITCSFTCRSFAKMPNERDRC